MGKVSFKNRTIHNVSCEWIIENKAKWQSWLPEDRQESGSDTLNSKYIALLSVGSLVLPVLILVLVYYIFRRRSLQSLNFVIPSDDLYDYNDDVHSVASFKSGNSGGSDDCKSAFSTKQYRGQKVYVEGVMTANFKLTHFNIRNINEAMKLRHENIPAILGICIRESSVDVVYEHYGSRDLHSLINSEFQWKDTIVFHVVYSSLKALLYLHSNISYGHAHGLINLKSIHILSNWKVKVGSYCVPGLHSSQQSKGFLWPTEREEIDESLSLWRAPEHIYDRSFSKSGDIFSMALIIYSLTDPKHRMPFADKPGEVSKADRVMAAYAQSEMPVIDPDASPSLMVELMQLMWDYIPSKRPSASECKSYLKRSLPNSITDSEKMAMQIVSEYNDELSRLVAERTTALQLEFKRSRDLLYKMVPESVADSLLRGKMPEPETVESCTVLFSDIVGFTSLCSNVTPQTVVEMLNSLYCTFDAIVEAYDVYKVETIGDAYFVVSGVPNRNGGAHVKIIAEVARDLMASAEEFEMPSEESSLVNEKMQMRIGLHTGQVVAAVVGNTMPRFSIFGDTVNVASRMESSSMPGRIQVSEASYLLLRQHYTLEERGFIDVKGKGQMKTFYLLELVDVRTVEDVVIKRESKVIKMNLNWLMANPSI